MSIFVINLGTNPERPRYPRQRGVRFPWMASLAAMLIDIGIIWSDSDHEGTLTEAHRVLRELGDHARSEIGILDAATGQGEATLNHNMGHEGEDQT
jgi:hypothetical protein